MTQIFQFIFSRNRKMSGIKSKQSRNQFDSINTDKKSSKVGLVRNTIESEDESEIEIVEEPKEALYPVKKLPLIDQIKRLNIQDWRNIPRCVKDTLQLYKDFILEEKDRFDEFESKATNRLDKNDNIRTRQTKKIDDTFKEIENKITTENTKISKLLKESNTSIKNQLNHELATFTTQIKDVNVENSIVKEKMKQVEAQLEITKEVINENKTDLEVLSFPFTTYTKPQLTV